MDAAEVVFREIDLAVLCIGMEGRAMTARDIDQPR